MNVIANQNPMIDALQSTTMLVTLAISAWTPIRVDRTLADDVAQARGTTGSRAFSVRKNLFAGADAQLKQLNAVQQDFRRYHYAHTLPFGVSISLTDRGPRLLSNTLFLDYCQRLAAARQAMGEALYELTGTYAECVEIARVNLADAYDENDYPDVASLPALFSIEVDFMPVPDGGGFRGLPEATLTKLKSYVERQTLDKTAGATASLVERLSTYLKRLTDRIDALDDTIDVEGARKATVRKSMFEDAASLASLVEAFPFADDDRMVAAVALLKEVAQHDAEALHDGPTRAAIKRQAESVYDCFKE
jgi:hypothetical protein